jgi:hypothetical protein
MVNVDCTCLTLNIHLSSIVKSTIKDSKLPRFLHIVYTLLVDTEIIKTSWITQCVI